MNWIEHPLQLAGENVTLRPLAPEQFEELFNAGNDPIIWTYMPIDGTDETQCRTAYTEALDDREKGEQYPFVVVENATGKIIGSTRYLNIASMHCKLEIGWTWYTPCYWSTGYNEECKLLLLTHAFESLTAVRVQIVTAEKNNRSRKAIERIGAKFEGVLRNWVLRRDGPRNTAFFSITDNEWPEAKIHLDALRRVRLQQTVDGHR